MKIETTTQKGAQRLFSRKRFPLSTRKTLYNPTHILADIAHALQTPLACIIGELSLLEKNIPTRGRTHIQKTQRIARNMSALIQNILYISRLNSSDLKPLMKSVSLTEMITTIVDDVTTLTSRRKINLTANIQKDIVIRGVSNKLEELIVAVLSNAIKYCKPRGKRIINIELYANNSSAVVQIQDNGIGIAPEELPYIFGRFYRTKNGSDQTERGTGLGLAIAKTIAEKHRATLTIESSLGVGTCVRITFPLKRQ
jgi:signal transduction histidine kinase